MTSFQFRSMLTGSSLLMVFAVLSCQPKDVDLRSAKTTVDSAQEQKVTEMKITDKNNFLALSIERSVEPLHYLRAKMDKSYAENNDLIYKIESQKPVDSDELDEEILRSKQVDLVRPTRVTSNISYKVDEFSIDPSGKLRKFVLIKNVFENSSLSSKKSEKVEISLIAQSFSEQMVIQPAAADNTYVVKVTRSDRTSLAKNKKDKNPISTVIDFESKIKIMWDGQKETLDQALKIVHFELTARRTLNQTGSVKVYDSAPKDLTVQLGNCVSMNGQINIPASETQLVGAEKITNPEELKIIDSSMIFQSQQESKAASCEVRPVVDLARVL